jgi:hypothetical protein
MNFRYVLTWQPVVFVKLEEFYILILGTVINHTWIDKWGRLHVEMKLEMAGICGQSLYFNIPFVCLKWSLCNLVQISVDLNACKTQV